MGKKPLYPHLHFKLLAVTLTPHEGQIVEPGIAASGLPGFFTVRLPHSLTCLDPPEDVPF